MTPAREGLFALRAHAKVNLDLRILATRADGYHELATVFQSLALHDTMTWHDEPGPFRLACSAPGVPVDDTNLVSRAVRAMWSATGRTGTPAGFSVRLEKRIPVQAGLGGGSADAAAALVALDRWWSLGWPTTRLAEVGAALGADVPFFLEGGTAEGRGRGDQLVSLPDLPSHAVLLFVPAFGVSTADAYRWYDEDAVPSDSAPRPLCPSTPDPRSIRPGSWPSEPDGWNEAFGRCRNDLEAPVAARHPAIHDLLRRVRPRARLAAMSGSGSAVFGLFASEEGATEACGRMMADGAGQGRRCFVARSIP